MLPKDNLSNKKPATKPKLKVRKPAKKPSNPTWQDYSKKEQREIIHALDTYYKYD